MIAGWSWSALLLAFFLSSTLASRVRQAEKLRAAGGRIAKPGARDAVQVSANGLVFAAAAAAFAVRPSALWGIAASGALAAAAADTWATEFGMLSHRPPRSVLTGRAVATGSSGGVTLLGTVASLAGSLCMAALAAIFSIAPAGAVLAGGIAGSLGDSVLGASLQARTHCPTCDEDSEERVHPCGTRTTHRGGVRWMDNDIVNLGATLIGATVALLVA
jgi:uncharacterized protein (TIGR00297 family)